MRRLLGITFFAMSTVLFGGFLILVGSTEWIRTVRVALDSGVQVGFGLSNVVTGVGLLRLQKWAHSLLLAQTLFFSLSNLWFLFWLRRGDVTHVTNLVWSGLILWYFLRPTVKAQFVKTATSNK